MDSDVNKPLPGTPATPQNTANTGYSNPDHDLEDTENGTGKKSLGDKIKEKLHMGSESKQV